MFQQETLCKLTFKLPWVIKTIFPYNIKQASDGNKEKYQLGGF